MKSYITTPIYYVNSSPHIGHAHTSVVADVLARIRRARGHEVFFTTGTDEHGQKNDEAAAKSEYGTVQEYLDFQSAQFRAAFDRLDIEYDMWVRTSNTDHIQSVEKALEAFHAGGEIEKRDYEGLYCEGCELFKRPTDLVDGKCPLHNTEPAKLRESNYFLRISKYQQWLRDEITAGNIQIAPEVYRDEVLAFLESDMEDLCLSRPKSRVKLGVTLPFDSEYVAYVWFDALLNYISNLKWPAAFLDDSWASVTHVMAKDIIKTHCIYWPIMLKMLGLPPPKNILVHGFWVGEGGQKMSKSLGNAMTPDGAVELVGVDALRFHLCRNLRATDSQISPRLLLAAYNTDLVNNLGNLFSRTVKLAVRNFEGGNELPEYSNDSDANLLIETVDTILGGAESLSGLDEVQGLSNAIIDAATEANSYFEKKAPWTLAKEKKTSELGTVLGASLRVLRAIFAAAQPVMPSKADSALKILQREDATACWPSEAPTEPLFPRRSHE